MIKQSLDPLEQKAQDEAIQQILKLWSQRCEIEVSKDEIRMPTMNWPRYGGEFLLTFWVSDEPNDFPVVARIHYMNEKVTLEEVMWFPDGEWIKEEVK